MPRLSHLLKSADGVASLTLRKVNLRGDQAMRWIIGGHVILSLTLAVVYDTWAITLPAALLNGGLFFGASMLYPASFATRCLAGICLQIFCMLHIYQLHGMAEMHFFFFTSTTAMILYQDPKAVWPGVILIILQHLAFALLHNTALVQVFFFEMEYVSTFKLFFHFGIALSNAFLCAYFASILRGRTVLDAFQKERLIAKNQLIQDTSDQLTIENERKTLELSQARELQLSIQPGDTLKAQSWQAIASMETCTEVGGDYYDYKMCGPDHAIIAIGDATGHGMRAAIVVAAAKAIFQRMAGRIPVGEIMREVSYSLEGLNMRSTYMGLTLIEVHGDKLTIISSGMPPVLIYRHATGLSERITEPGPFLGFMTDKIVYPSHNLMAQPGDLLLAYTDGLYERRNATASQMGWETLIPKLGLAASMQIEQALESVLSSAKTFSEDRPLEDDTTALMIRFSPEAVLELAG